MTPREELRQIIKATSSALPIPAQAAVGMVWKRLDAVLADLEERMQTFMGPGNWPEEAFSIRDAIEKLDERISMLERGDNGDRY